MKKPIIEKYRLFNKINALHVRQEYHSDDITNICVLLIDTTNVKSINELKRILIDFVNDESCDIIVLSYSNDFDNGEHIYNSRLKEDVDKINKIIPSNSFNYIDGIVKATSYIKELHDYHEIYLINILYGTDIMSDKNDVYNALINMANTIKQLELNIYYYSIGYGEYHDPNYLIDFGSMIKTKRKYYFCNNNIELEDALYDISLYTGHFNKSIKLVANKEYKINMQNIYNDYCGTLILNEDIQDSVHIKGDKESYVCDVINGNNTINKLECIKNYAYETVQKFIETKLSKNMDIIINELSEIKNYVQNYEININDITFCMDKYDIYKKYDSVVKLVTEFERIYEIIKNGELNNKILGEFFSVAYENNLTYYDNELDTLKYLAENYDNKGDCECMGLCYYSNNIESISSEPISALLYYISNKKYKLGQKQCFEYKGQNITHILPIYNNKTNISIVLEWIKFMKIDERLYFKTVFEFVKNNNTSDKLYKSLIHTCKYLIKENDFTTKHDFNNKNYNEIVMNITNYKVWIGKLITMQSMGKIKKFNDSQFLLIKAICNELIRKKITIHYKKNKLNVYTLFKIFGEKYDKWIKPHIDNYDNICRIEFIGKINSCERLNIFKDGVHKINESYPQNNLTYRVDTWSSFVRRNNYGEELWKYITDLYDLHVNDIVNVLKICYENKCYHNDLCSLGLICWEQKIAFALQNYILRTSKEKLKNINNNTFCNVFNNIDACNYLKKLFIKYVEDEKKELIDMIDEKYEFIDENIFALTDDMDIAAACLNNKFIGNGDINKFVSKFQEDNSYPIVNKKIELLITGKYKGINLYKDNEKYWKPSNKNINKFVTHNNCIEKKQIMELIQQLEG